MTTETKEATQETTEVADEKEKTEEADKGADKGAEGDQVKDTDKEKSTDSDKGDSAKGEDRIVPERYELNPPKDSQIKEEQIEAVAAFAKEHKLTNSEAQAILERENAVIAAYAEQQKQQNETLVEEASNKWLEEVKADKELGGANFEKTNKLTQRVLKRFDADGSLSEELEKTGLGNYKPFVKFVNEIGKLMKDDDFERGTNTTQTRKSNAEVFYGKESEE